MKFDLSFFCLVYKVHVCIVLLMLHWIIVVLPTHDNTDYVAQL